MGSVIGTHANAWNVTSVGVNGVSTALELQDTGFVSVFGNCSGKTNITIQYSQDGVNFYDGPLFVLGGSADFYFDLHTGARFVRLKSSDAVTITATIAGKG